MAPNHDWKDDAEFIRYNPPEAPRWPCAHPWLAVLGVICLNTILTYVLLKQTGWVP